MSDDASRWFTAGHQPKQVVRQKRVGHEVWQLRDKEGHVIRCELYDDTAVGAGWDVRLSAADHPIYSQRCADRVGAGVIAQALREDALRSGGIAFPPQTGGSPKAGPTMRRRRK
jgi:hypothetical protein